MDRNLIRNAGADDGPGSPTGDVVPVPAWHGRHRWFTAVQYGAVDPTGLPFPMAASGPPDGGVNFFAGGPANAGALAVQIISLPTKLLASIDAGTATYRFAAWLGGFEDQNDLCEPVVLFTDAAGAPLDRGFLIGGQAADRNNETKLLPYRPGARYRPVPAQRMSPWRSAAPTVSTTTATATRSSSRSHDRNDDHRPSAGSEQSARSSIDG